MIHTAEFEPDRKGMVLRIERSSIHDGDGFRTVVFLKGCPLRCQWCSTPESQAFCPEPAGETVYGTEMSVGGLMREIRKDSAFFFHSGGGVTLSGGEMLSQPEFSRAILKNSCIECIDTAVETSLFAPWDTVSELMQYVHTAYADLKLFDRELHKFYTGVSNELILENLRKTASLPSSFRLIVRIPVIPGINDSEKELKSMGAFAAGLKRLELIQLLPYHKLGAATYEKLNRPYLLEAISPPSAEHMGRCREIVEGCGVRVI